MLIACALDKMKKVYKSSYLKVVCFVCLNANSE